MLEQGGRSSGRLIPLLLNSGALVATSSAGRVDGRSGPPVAAPLSQPLRRCCDLELPPGLPYFSGLEGHGRHGLNKCHRGARPAKHHLQLGHDMPYAAPYG